MVASWVVFALHLDDISTTNTADTGACRGEEGYFAAAMVAFNNLTPKQRELVLEDAYVDTYNRVSAWADANGKTLDINDDGEVVVVSQLIHNLDNRLAGFDDEDSSSVILAITALSAGALGALYLFKKKRVA